MSPAHPQPIYMGAKNLLAKGLAKGTMSVIRVLTHKQGMFCELKVSPLRTCSQGLEKHWACIVTNNNSKNTHNLTGPGIILGILHKLTHISITTSWGSIAYVLGPSSYP